MSLTKVNYIDNSTIITAKNLNDIQDNVIQNAELIKKAAPRNLLDNSDFTNPINQRLETSYTSSNTNWCYGIDRWLGVNDGIVTVENGYVNFKSVNGNEAILVQLIESNKIKNGKKYTLVCELSDGSIFSKIITASIDNYDGIDIGQNSAIFLGNDSNLNTLYFVGFQTMSTNGINIKNVSLYEGEYTADNLPTYQPNGYGAELAECQRYFLKVKKLMEGVNFRTNTQQYHFTYYFPTTMRVKPSITMVKYSDAYDIPFIVQEENSVYFVDTTDWAIAGFEASADL